MRVVLLLRACKTGLLLAGLCLVYIALTVSLQYSLQDTTTLKPRTESKPKLKPNIEHNPEVKPNIEPMPKLKPKIEPKPNVNPGSSKRLVSKIEDVPSKDGMAKDVLRKADLAPQNKQKSINTAVGGSTDTSSTPGLYRVQGFSNDIYLFSVVLGNSSSVHPYDSIVIQGLENSKYKNTSFRCCIKHKSGSLWISAVTRKNHWTSTPNGRLAATQYTCPRNPGPRNNELATAVTLIGANKLNKCHQNYALYLTPHYAQVHKQEIAVCTKLVYSDVDPSDIMTWFEIHRRLGVDKFIAYTYNLKPDATKVLQYYKTKGMVEIHPFSLPKINQGKQLVAYGSKSFEAWNIEQTLVFDCYERLKGYKYLLVLDIDEYLIPHKVKRLPTLFENLWKLRPPAAGFSFLVHLHITSWKATNQQSEFTVGKYTQRKAAIDDRMKHVIKPDRLALGGLSSYSFTPGKNYKRFRVAEVEATIHHFRSCEKTTDWQKEMDKTCVSLGKFKDTSVADMLAPLEKDILKLRSKILKKG